jgi:hypothetical protein
MLLPDTYGLGLCAAFPRECLGGVARRESPAERQRARVGQQCATAAGCTQVLTGYADARGVLKGRGRRSMRTQGALGVARERSWNIFNAFPAFA